MSRHNPPRTTHKVLRYTGVDSCHYRGHGDAIAKVKKGFQSESLALASVGNPEHFRAYECKKCGFWHLATRKKKK